MAKKKPQKPLIPWPPGGLGTPEAYEMFKKMIVDDNARYGNTPEGARQSLIDSGILTKTGRLAKRFR